MPTDRSPGTGTGKPSPIKPTIITFTCGRKPAVNVEDGKDRFLTVTKKWNEAGKTVTSNFDHAEGGGEFCDKR